MNDNQTYPAADARPTTGAASTIDVATTDAASTVTATSGSAQSATKAADATNPTPTTGAAPLGSELQDSIGTLLSETEPPVVSEYAVIEHAVENTFKSLAARGQEYASHVVKEAEAFAKAEWDKLQVIVLG